ncbi:MAG: YoaK family protein [Candidatus Nanopelagicales bacterium]
MSPAARPTDRVLLAALVALTVVSGVVDAVSFLALGRVFTANMTGNVVMLGFAAAGVEGFSVAASLTSVTAFVAGALVGGRLAGRPGDRRTRLVAALVGEAVLVAAAAALALSVPDVGTGWARLACIALLALAMGSRNAALRRLALGDVATTVLTSTLTGLAADSSLAGGDSRSAGRRLAAVLALAAGAAAGAWLLLRHGPGPVLLVAAALTAATALATALAAALTGRPARPATPRTPRTPSAE